MKKETKPVQSTQEQPFTAKDVFGDTEAGKIWEEIKNKPIAMFGLPNQIISQYCAPTPVDPSRLYVMLTATAVLPSLEFAVGSGYTVELAGKYVIVARAPQVK
jgi:hypothetical protein